MSTRKTSKGTRKLLQHKQQTNRRRISHGKKPLKFQQFVKHSRKRKFHEVDTATSKRPAKKQRLNPKTDDDLLFGFGEEPSQEEALDGFLNGSENESSDEESKDEEGFIPFVTTDRPSKQALQEQNEKLKKEILEHQNALKELQEEDPDFYKYLKETNQDMLEFGAVKLDEIDDIDDAVSQIQEEEDRVFDDDSDSVEMDTGIQLMSLVQLEQETREIKESQSLPALKRVLSEFCRCVQLSSTKNKEAESAPQLAVARSPIFAALLKYCLCELAPHLPKVLKLDETHVKNPKLLKKHKTFQRHMGLVRRYIKSVYQLLTSTTDESMQRLLLIHSKNLSYVIFALGDVAHRLFCRRAIVLWANASPTIRIDAFLFLYEMGKHLPDRKLMKLLKYMYQSYLTVCKKVSSKSIPDITFMMNGLVQMHLINPVVSYQESFSRLRSIAFHVKQAIQTMAKPAAKEVAHQTRHEQKLQKAKEYTIQSIFNWRFVNTLRLWAKVLSSHAGIVQSDIHLLYYPFTQIVLSTLTLSRSATYDPCRLKLIAALIEIIEACETCGNARRRIYIPLAPHILQILNNPAFGKKTKPLDPSQWSAFTLETLIRVPPKKFNSSPLHASLVNECTRLLALFFEKNSYSIAFPELFYPVETFLQRFLNNPGIPQYLKENPRVLHRKLKQNTTWVLSKRRNVGFAPSNATAVEQFLSDERRKGQSPMSKFLKGQQYEELTKPVDVMLFSKRKKRKKTVKKAAKKKRKEKEVSDEKAMVFEDDVQDLLLSDED